MLAVESSYEISLLEAGLVNGHNCFACGDEIIRDDVFVVSISVPRQDIFYMHDEDCFDSFITGLNQFDLMRAKMRREDKVN